MRIPLCAIIFGAASRSLELQLQAFPQMINVDAALSSTIESFKQTALTCDTTTIMTVVVKLVASTLTDLTATSRFLRI